MRVFMLALAVTNLAFVFINVIGFIECRRISVFAWWSLSAIVLCGSAVISLTIALLK